MILIDQPYLNTLKYILENGVDKPDRTDVGSSKSVFGHLIKHRIESLGNGIYRNLPFIQCRWFEPKHAFTELMWMLNGRVDNQYLVDRGVNFWTAQTSEEFLQGTGIEVGTIGKGYGYQFRNFSGVDQLANVVESLRNDPYSRRHIINLWNVPNLPKMALCVCHFVYTFMCVPDEDGRIKLNLHVHMRSNDVYLGLPYNLAFTGIFLILMAELLGYTTGEILYTATDAHLYSNQLEVVERLLSVVEEEGVRSDGLPLFQPQMTILKPLETFEDMLSLEWEDVALDSFNKGRKGYGVKMAV